VDTGLVPAEIGEPLEVGDDTLSVDIRHVRAPFPQLVEVGRSVS